MGVSPVIENIQRRASRKEFSKDLRKKSILNWYEKHENNLPTLGQK
jgi:hypothetical protein